MDAPTRIAQTAAGPVGYREVGAGRPLLLVMGLGGSMDDWQPAFVASLATGHKIVVFDNAGVGETAAVAPDISAMANQASALISTLRLGPTAVLGWSMGGMIAQALAVLHPAQAPRTVITTQEQAIRQWMAGQDPAGRKLGDVRLPTLVADGTADQLDPAANDRALARSVPGSTLILYPGAGHAFLFQDSASSLPAVMRFLGP